MSHASAAMGPGPKSATGTPLLFHSLAPAGHETRRGRAGTTALASGLLHAGLIACALLVPLLGYHAVPDPAAVATLFAPPLQLDPAPPPPPPPPTGARAAARPALRIDEAPSAGLVTPVEVPAEIRPDQGIDLGPSGGTEGGVPGGVPGGVVGAVVGGLPLSTAPPPPKLAPVRPGGDIRRPVKIRNVLPQYPHLALQARVEGAVILECTISTEGRVTDVRVLRGLPLLERAAIEAVRQWVYTPTLLNGVPVPVVMTVTVQFGLRGRSRSVSP